MFGLTLPDAAAVLYLVWRVVHARKVGLGDSLHGLLTLVLLIALFLGFRITRELRELLGNLADAMQAIPGLGSKLGVIGGAWYLSRLLREQTAYWIERRVPAHLHRRTTALSEALRAGLLTGFIAWLAQGWYEPATSDVPYIVQALWVSRSWTDDLLQ